MPKFCHNKDEFWKWSPGAAEIFAHLSDNSDVNKMPWGFDIGEVSDDKRYTSASFSCVASSGWGRDKLTISASMGKDGLWQIKHTITIAS